MSAESGLKTFRDAGGLWEGHDVTKVASPTGWRQFPEMVLDFYNQRRRQAQEVEPNAGHKALTLLEDLYNVVVITQNVDGLHERAGSSLVLHLHGELSKVRGEREPEYVYEIGGDSIEMGDTCEIDSQLRPHVVWFGEQVPMIMPAAHLCRLADFFLVIGTSLAVYPAAGLVDEVRHDVPKFVIDKKLPPVRQTSNVTPIEEPATTGVPRVVEELLKLS